MPRKRSNPRTTTKAGQALTRMREGSSLKKASREVGIDPRTVARVAGSALKQASSGRYVPARAIDFNERSTSRQKADCAMSSCATRSRRAS